MFAQEDKPPPPPKLGYILGIAFATAALSTLGSKLVDWAVEEIKSKYATKPPPKEEKKAP
jgi:hypothetical protein